MMKKLIFAALAVCLAACASNNASYNASDAPGKDITLNDALSLSDFEWTREPESSVIKGDTIEIVSKPGTGPSAISSLTGPSRIRHTRR